MSDMVRRFLGIILVVLLPLVLVIGLAAGLDVSSPPSLGHGSKPVSAPPLEVTKIQWFTKADASTPIGPPTLLWKVGLTIKHTQNKTENFDIYVTLKDTAGKVLGWRAEQDKAINGGGGLSNEFLFLTVDTPGIVPSDIPVADIASIHVTAGYYTAGQPIGEFR